MMLPAEPAVATTPTTSAGPDLRQLCEAFPALNADEIVSVVVDARRSVDLFGLPADDMAVMVNKIVLEQLRQRVGESDAGGLPRLDPERHQRRR